MALNTRPGRSGPMGTMAAHLLACAASLLPAVPPLPAFPAAARACLTLGLAAVAALAAEAVQLPLPWMIGPLLATAAGSLRGWPLQAPRPLMQGGQWIIGTALGLYFTPEVVGVLGAHAGAIVAGIAWALAMGAGFGWFLARTNAGPDGPDRATTYFASAIGAASEMAVLAQRHGGRVDLVAAAHSLRVAMVVVLIPFGFQLAGIHGLDPLPSGPRVVDPAGLAALAAVTGLAGLALQRLGQPNPWLMGPLAVAAALTAGGIEWSALPPALGRFGQLCVGVALGVRFTPGFGRTAPRWLGTVALGTLGLIGLNAAFAVVLARWSGLHPATVMLGTSPGGIAEMCITATALQVGVPIVTAFHVTRMVAVIVLAGPLFRWRQRTARP